MNLQRALNPRLIEGQLIIIVWLLRYLWHFKYRKGKHNTQFKLRIKVRHHSKNKQNVGTIRKNNQKPLNLLRKNSKLT